MPIRDPSQARQDRKLAAALRQEDAPDAVPVNSGTDDELLRALSALPKFRNELAERVVALRPFTSKTDLLERVNEGIETAQARLGPTWIPRLRIDGVAQAEQERAAYLPKRRGRKKQSDPRDLEEEHAPEKRTKLTSVISTTASSAGGSGSGSPSSPEPNEESEPHVAQGESDDEALLDCSVSTVASTATCSMLSSASAAPLELPNEALDVLLDQLLAPGDLAAVEIDAADEAASLDGGSSHGGIRPVSGSVARTFPPSPPATTVNIEVVDVPDQISGLSEWSRSDAHKSRRLVCMRGAASVIVLTVEFLAFLGQLIEVAFICDPLRRASLALATRWQVWEGLRRGPHCKEGAAAELQEPQQEPQAPGGLFFFSPETPTCRQMIAERKKHTHAITRVPTAIVFVAATVYLCMLSLAILFDWPWYPRSLGWTLWETSAMRQVQTHTISALSLIFVAYLCSRWCTPRTYDVVLTAYITAICTLLVIPFGDGHLFDIQRNSTCAMCSSLKELSYVNYVNGTDSSRGYQSIRYGLPAQHDDPRARLYGLVIKSRMAGEPYPDDYGLGMHPQLEEWVRNLQESALDDQMYLHFYGAIVAVVCPLPPLQTVGITTYYAILTWYFKAVDIQWAMPGMEKACCSLAVPLKFQAGPLIGLLLIFCLYRQHCSCQYCLLRKQAERGHRLRIEQLAREKERLDYERLLEMKLRLLATRMLDERGEVRPAAEAAPDCKSLNAAPRLRYAKAVFSL